MGDFYPFFYLALILKSRGHDVCIVTNGFLDKEAIKLRCEKAGIKVYTIGVGTYKEYIIKKVGFFEQRIPIPPLNDATLKDIAATTGGQYFRATSTNGLEGIFNKINSLETREIKENHYRTTTSYYHIYLQWGIIALLAVSYTHLTLPTTSRV